MRVMNVMRPELLDRLNSDGHSALWLALRLGLSDVATALLDKGVGVAEALVEPVVDGDALALPEGETDTVVLADALAESERVLLMSLKNTSSPSSIMEWQWTITSPSAKVSLA
jgi:hypothetical protein